jgi:DNA-binding ferritin-like protein
MARNETAKRREPLLRTPPYLNAKNVQKLTPELNILLADVFAIYIKLSEDNQAFAARMIEIHGLCGETNDFATARFLENWIRPNAAPNLVPVRDE